MSKLNILILGRSGKMGKLIEGLIGKDHHVIGPINRDEKVEFSENIDLCFDFSSPEFLINCFDDLLANNIKLISGTTGFSKQQFLQLRNIADHIVVFYASNFSLGIHSLIQASKMISKQIGSYSDIDIIEKHHSEKKDMPSGTAISIAKSIQDRVNKKIGFHSIRSGKIIGDHTVQFSLDSEILEITHQAINRSVFAKGAVSIIPFLMEKKSGFYTMEDFLNIGSK